MSAVTANHDETDILVGCHSMHLLSWMTKNHMLVDAVNIKSVSYTHLTLPTNREV